jgi:hypothetical protein
MPGDWIRRSCFSRTWLRILDHEQHATGDFAAFVERMLEVGCVYLRLSSRQPPTRPLQYQGCDVLQISFCPPFCVPAHEACQYLQLDASFRPTQPWAYCAPQAMVCNEAIPVGFSIAPTESRFLYACFFKDMAYFYPQMPLSRKSVLSDGGLALAKFCRDFARRRFDCHRHLIEAWCASSYCGGFVARSLREELEDEFKRVRKRVLEEAKVLLDENVITKKLYDELEAFLNGVATGGRWTHGIWDRIDDALARCTQSAERFHGIVNKMLRLKMPLVERLMQLFTAVMTRWTQYSGLDGPRRRQLMAAIEALQAHPGPQVAKCENPKCVQHTRIMGSRFRVPLYPCTHTIGDWNPDLLEDLPQIVPLPLPERREDRLKIDYVTPPECHYREDWLSSPARRPKRAKVWDDETTVKESKCGEELSTPEYEAVMGILDNISSLRKRNPKNRKLVKSRWALAIRDHMARELAKRGKVETLSDWLASHSDEDDTVRWVAGIAARFSMWAAGDGPLPDGFPPLSEMVQPAETPEHT